MSKVSICLELSFDNVGLLDLDCLESNYQRVYKPLITFLYSHPKFPITFSFTGMQLEFYEHKHPEVIDILHELTKRKQVEVLGGGYYVPILPLLFPVDRSAQIEKMSSAVRNSTGKRPRGMTVFGSIWDSSLITTIQSCGMEYVHLDNTVIPSGKVAFLPLMISEQAKALKVIPLFKNFIPSVEETGEHWLEKIKKYADKEMKNYKIEGIEVNPIVSIPFSLDEFLDFMSSPCFEYVNNYDGDDFIFTTPQQYLKTAKRFVPSYVPAGMDWTIAQWARKSFVKCENQTRFPLTIHDYLNLYVYNKHLYDRMMYISMLISQCHGDRMRKNAAHEKLWEAQCGFNYLDLSSGLPSLPEVRQKSYSLLNEAERYIRESSPFRESITSFDYNGDGLNEYVCQMDKYFAVISLMSGCVTDLSIMSSDGNYAESLSRLEQFDKISDDYIRGFFVDHLLDRDDMEEYKNDSLEASGIFSKVQFTEKKFDTRRKEIQLEGCGEFSSLNLGVSLRKNYNATSNGMVVQYILKNMSPLPLKGVFVVEFNFAQTEFGRKGEEGQFTTEFIHNSNKTEIPCGQNISIDSGISCFQVEDHINKNSFVFEPNEEAGLCCSLLTYNRPVSDTDIVVASKNYKYALYWDIDLSAGMEIEKTINLSIVAAKKKK